jgi:5-methyltetrahydropteroyltriglutamate--homocysteine methyltransferase
VPITSGVSCDPRSCSTRASSFAPGAIDLAQLRRVEDDAIRGIVKFQEEPGAARHHRLVNTGARTFTSTSSHSWAALRRKAAFTFASTVRKGEVDFEPPVMQVTDKVRHDKPIQRADFEFLRSVTSRTAKVTIPSPTMLHFRGGRGAISREAYPDLESFYADVAAGYADELQSLGAAGCTYVQFDDTNLAYLCDEKMREGARQRGDDPNELPRRYAKLINAAIKDRPKGMAVCIHLCRGNFKSAWAAEGGYEPVAEVLFNELAVDGYFLEYDDARSGDFAPLRHVPKGKTVVLGLVSTKVGTLESKDDLKRRIDAAAKLVPLDQLCLSPQCGFSSTVHGNDIAVESQAAKLRLVVETARDVWGGV